MSKGAFDHFAAIRSIDLSACFLCGCKLDATNASQEHVVPQWLQRRHDLWSQELVLSNQSSIRYGTLKIPCCKQCNNEYLSEVERKVESAFRAGASAVAKLGDHLIFVWLAKIYYGLLYKELFLRLDRRSRSSETITSVAFLEEFVFLRAMLQSLRLTMKIIATQPGAGFPLASIFVFGTQALADPRMSFNLQDSKHARCILIASDSVAIVAALQDGGTIRHAMGSTLAPLQRIKAHPIQVAEVMARVIYATTLLVRHPKYLGIGDQNSYTLAQLPLFGFSTKPLFAQWDDNAFAPILAAHARMPLEAVSHPLGGIKTFISDDKGEAPFIDINQIPWPLDPRANSHSCSIVVVTAACLKARAETPNAGDHALSTTPTEASGLTRPIRTRLPHHRRLHASVTASRGV